ncbi:MAG TPA: fructosamine kinase family protein [Thermosynechococcus sp. M3746_W2019_013]|nr:fructosamine kinase family protein [Thermosynechococcus sp. M3746_W2019_013]
MSHLRRLRVEGVSRWQQLWDQFAAATGRRLHGGKALAVGGGSINTTYVWQHPEQTLFVKFNRPERQAMFAAEANALGAIAKVQTIRVPLPLLWGVVEDASFLVLEYLPLTQAGDWWQMGVKLAQLHLKGTGDRYGWSENNTIGATPQMNPWSDNWGEFFRDARLRYQFDLARRRGGYFPKAEKLLAVIPELLNHEPTPTLVHGDLWSGNAAFCSTGEPVIFDPASYYGDREVDLAMSELFGGFPAAFYEGYNATYPLTAGYEQRKTIYNLYHILNHFNLFGGSYAAQAQSMIEQIL